MTETRTSRHELPQWGSGADSGSRQDFDEAFEKLDNQAPYDTGATLAALPAAGKAARYVLVSLTGGYRTLYRDDGATWDAVGGNTLPRHVHFRALDGQARTDNAVTFSHPDAANPGATLGYDGSAVLSGTVRVYDDDESARGVLMVGTDAAADPTARGRVHVRTRADGEQGLVVQAHGSGAGHLLAVRNSGGSNVTTVDALGRLQQRNFSAFGGAALPTASTVAIAPTSATDDGIANGLLLYGQAGDASGKTILTVQPDAATDTTAIGLVTRTGMTWGRLPWGTPSGSNGVVTLAGNTVYARASGNPDNTAYFSVRRSDPTSPATEANPANDVGLLTVGKTGISTGLPLSVSQRYQTGSATLTLYRVTDFAAAFLDLGRLVPAGGGGETVQLASSWRSDGRLNTGAWWKATGTTRDARQPVSHCSRKTFVGLGGSDLAGQNVNQDETYTYSWPTMTVRSATTTDLEIFVGIEFHLLWRPDGIVDTNGFFVDTLVSVDGGSFAVADSSFVTPTPNGTTSRNGSNNVMLFHRRTSVATDKTFAVQTRFRMGSSLPGIRLRTIDLRVQEAIVENYAAI
ncbi:MAG: hypothetical protein HOY78_02365 [Saccharothrix sp.]|nr:hypothetical protein [Saccharothrix sp.]